MKPAGCFQLNKATESRLELARQSTGLPEASLFELCVEAHFLKGVPLATAERAIERIAEIGNALAQAAFIRGVMARTEPLVLRLRPELAQLVNTAALERGVTAAEIAETAVEKEIDDVNSKIYDVKWGLKDFDMILGVIQLVRQAPQQGANVLASASQYHVPVVQQPQPAASPPRPVAPTARDYRELIYKVAPWSNFDEPVKVNIRQAAGYLGVSVRTVRRLIRTHQLSVEVLGHRTQFIYITVLESFMRDRRTWHREKIRIPKTNMQTFDPCI